MSTLRFVLMRAPSDADCSLSPALVRLCDRWIFPAGADQARSARSIQDDGGAPVPDGHRTQGQEVGLGHEGQRGQRLPRRGFSLVDDPLTGRFDS